MERLKTILRVSFWPMGWKRIQVEELDSLDPDLKVYRITGTNKSIIIKKEKDLWKLIDGELREAFVDNIGKAIDDHLSGK